MRKIENGQYFFSLVSSQEGTSLVVEEKPRLVNHNGELESEKEWVERTSSEIPPVPDNLPEPIISPNGIRVLEARYLQKDSVGQICETSKALFWRVAYNIGMADRLHNSDPMETERVTREFYSVMARLEFLPNSPTLMNAGTKAQQLSGCFVLPVEDSLESIMEAVKRAANIHQSGGGTGFSFSNLRPQGSLIESSGGQATGPTSYMEIFDAATDVLKRGGRERGANMGLLRVDHPDIEQFIAAKEKPGQLENFNLSVAVTDEFMRAVEEDGEYELVNPHTGEREKIQARPIFDQMVKGAWKSGEPGMVFIDKVNQRNPTKHLGLIESVNVCGEQPLHPYESCNLGSINLSKFVRNGRIDWERLKQVTRTAVHFLDNVIDLNQYPLPEIEEITLENRRIGLGAMGFADMLVQLGVAYNSEEGVKIGKRVMKFIQEIGYDESARLAQKRGCFPNWDGSEHQKTQRKMRNATITTIAPTGSIGIIAGCSSGIEPLYALCYQRKKPSSKEAISEFNPYFLSAARVLGLGNEIIDQVKHLGKLGDVNGIPEKVKRVFVTAHEISPEWHVRMQAAFQEYTDNAVSKTVNLPPNASIEAVHHLFLSAWKTGCKGITVYRAGSRKKQVLDTKESQKELQTSFDIRPRPDSLPAENYKIETPVGAAYITVSFKEQMPFEVFVVVGKTGTQASAECEALGRLITLLLRSNPKESIPKVLNALIDQLRGIGGGDSIGFGPKKVRSVPDAIAKVLMKYSDENES